VSDQIRKAASVVAAREGGDGPEVLVLERGAESRFLPGYVVFPGGALEPGDVELARRWFGTADEAGRAAAVRELAEEAGLALTSHGVVAGGDADPLSPIHAAPPQPSRLHDIARWIAPPQVPVRFDAHFYALSVDGGAEPQADGHEAAHAWWASPSELIAEWEGQRRKLYWPTYFTMAHLASCRTVAELLRLSIRTREPDDRELEWLHRSTFWQD
jgi:8-oxo-dGTP pyrophosphatase MutT (NUDIX family)